MAGTVSRLPGMEHSVEEPVAGTVSAAGKRTWCLLIEERGELWLNPPSFRNTSGTGKTGPTGFKEWTALGDGIVAFLVLVGGDPVLENQPLQVCCHLAAAGQKVLYISGEESLKQTKMRAKEDRTVIGNCAF